MTDELVREHMARERGLRRYARVLAARLVADPDLGARIASGTALPQLVAGVGPWGKVVRETERRRKAAERRGS